MKPIFKNHNNVIIIVANDNYCNQAKSLFYSLYNNDWHGDYLLITDNSMSEDNIKSFEKKKINVRVYDDFINYSKFNKIGKHNGSNILYQKLYIFDTFIKNWEIILYLDCDIIVQKNIKNLLNFDKNYIDNENIYVDKESKTNYNTKLGLFSQFNISDDKNLPYYHYNNNHVLTLKKELEKKYNMLESNFNTGCILFNSNIIKNDTIQKLKELSEKYYCISRNADQGIINIYFYKKWKQLPQTFIKYKKTKDINIDKCNLIHTLGGNRAPWKENNLYYKQWKNNLHKF